MVPNRNFVKTVLSAGGVIKPLMVSPSDSKGLGLCNPSVFVDNGEIWVNLRSVNYTLYHCENEQIFNNRWGPHVFTNPENDPTLRTCNFLCKLNSNLDIERYWKIDTSKLDTPPLWEFIGLEDARLVRWDGHLYGIGCRRDTTTNGQSRMELSELEVTDTAVKEIGRYRIEHPVNPEWYCEKNWMPVLDMPYHFIKWTNPAELIKADLATLKSFKAREVDESDKVDGIPFLKGGSQVIPWKDYRICLVHHSDLFRNKLQQRDVTYAHRFVVYDRDWHIVKIGDQFSFMGAEVEFVCGMAIYEGDMLITFGFQDNCAFILRVPAKMIPRVLGLPELDWGAFEISPSTVESIRDEVLQSDLYQKKFRVQEGDVVLDIGASVGPFIWNIRGQKPGRIIAVEPDQRFIKTLRKNCLPVANLTVIEKGISDLDVKFTTTGLFSGRYLYGDYGGCDPVEIDGIKFSTLIAQNGIGRIDFLKMDCEGAEYDIFNDENLEWIMENVKKIAGEFHLHTAQLNAKWSRFRDTYLKRFRVFSVYSADGAEITPEVWTDRLTNYYTAVMVYIDNTHRTKWMATPYPSLEVTTLIPPKGCPMRCSFCPQEKIVSAYKGIQNLSFENFQLLVKKIPKEVQISFAGFCEPFLNPDCTAMIESAHNAGHKISIFTTAIGMKMNDLERIKDIPFTGIQGGFVLHLPDVEGYTPLEKSNGHLGILSEIKKAGLVNFESMTMGTLPEKLKAIFPDTIRRSMFSRAGNLTREDVSYTKPDVRGGPTTCGCRERLYHNVLLPNGDISLCCMDYSLQHILGNLYHSPYEEIVPDDGQAFDLCRKCENGVPA